MKPEKTESWGAAISSTVTMMLRTVALLGTGANWPDPDGWPDDAVDDNFSSIENLVGTKFNAWPAADADANRLEGRRGNDWIFGGSDEDTLLDGQGHDNLSGGRGDGVLFGGVGADNLFGDGGR